MDNPEASREKDLELYRDLLAERRRRSLDSPWEFYVPLPHQAKFHVSKARIRAFISSNRSGKTEAHVIERIRTALGINPHRKHRVPNYGWFVSVSNEAQRDILQPKFEKYLPKHMLKNIIKRQRGIWDQLILPQGSVVGFKSCEQEDKVFEGAALDWASCDEEPEKSKWDALKARLVDYGGDLAITMTPVNGMSWSHDAFVDPATREKDLEVFTASMWDNAVSRGGHIEDKWIREFEESIPDPIMRRIRVYGEYHSQVGRIYKLWDPAVHVIDELPPHILLRDGTIHSAFETYCTLDTGRSFAAGFYAVDYLGNVFKFDEYYNDSDGADGTIGARARAVLNIAAKWGIWPDFSLDPSSQFFIDLSEAGLPVSHADNDVEKGIAAVQEYLAFSRSKPVGQKFSNPRYYVVGKRCPRTLYEYPRYQWDAPAISGAAAGEKKNKPRKKDDHCFPSGTLIMADGGEKPIETIHPGERVLTRGGYRFVTKSGMTRLSESLVKLETTGGLAVQATPDHPVWVVGKGFVPMDAIRTDDMILACLEYDSTATSVRGVERVTRGSPSGKAGFALHRAAPRGGDGPATDLSPHGAYGAGLGSSTTHAALISIVRQRVVRVTAVSAKVAVYDLTVEENHEFFANRILVHNCMDCDRYMLVKRPAASRPPEGEEDKRPLMERITERVQEKAAGRNRERERYAADPMGIDDY